MVIPPFTIIALAADHRGFALKEQLKRWLEEQGCQLRDFGARVYDGADDYPDFVTAAAQFVASDLERARGIVICGSGQGAAIGANKVLGIRAELIDRSESFAPDEAPNVLALAADQLSLEDAQAVINRWLKPAEPLADRHQRRIEKIAAFERSGRS